MVSVTKIALTQSYPEAVGQPTGSSLELVVFLQFRLDAASNSFASSLKLVLRCWPVRPFSAWC